jgi:ketosteroid isomerase-like protein
VNRLDENRALMDRYLAAWQSGDVAAVQAAYSTDVVMHIQGRSRHAGTYRGLAEWSRAIDAINADTNGRAEIVDVHDVLVSDDHAVALVRERFTSDAGSVDTNRVVVYGLRDGRIAEIWTYDSDPYAYDELFPRTGEASR